MKIIKEGRKDPELFHCTICGCEFETELSECDMAQEVKDGFGQVIGFSLKTECPNCGFNAYSAYTDFD